MGGQVGVGTRARSSVDSDPPSTAPGWWAQRFWWAVAGLAIAAAAVRLFAVYDLARTSPLGVGGDGFYYVNSAALFADGGGFGYPSPDGAGIPDALHPPLWTAYLGTANWLGATTVEQMGVAASILGVATVVLIALAGRQILSARAGVIAGAVAAVYPAFWTYERNLNAEAITFPLLAATILLAYRYKDRPSLGRCLALAAVLGLLALSRSEQALLIPAMFVPLVLATPAISWGQRVGRLALSGVVVLLLISPWTIYNLDRFERPVILSAGAGNAMLAGACDTTFSGQRLGWYDSDCNQKNPVFWANTDRTVQDPLLRDEAISYTLDHLDRLPVVVFAREGRSWGFYRPAQQTELHADAVGFSKRVIWAQNVMYWAMVPLAVAGTVVLRRRRIMVYPLLVVVAICVISTAMTFGDIRYRAPAEIPLVLLAAVTLDVLVGRWRARSGTREPGPSTETAPAVDTGDVVPEGASAPGVG